jgi:hypothetical protein
MRRFSENDEANIFHGQVINTRDVITALIFIPNLDLILMSI